MKRVLIWLAALLVHAVGATLRVRKVDHGGILDQPDHPPVIIAFWHNRIMTAAIFWHRYCRPRRALTFISRSRDGQVISDMAAHFGIEAARGSSSKKGIAATLAAVHSARDEQLDLVITPDGPRGPRGIIQPGLLRLAQMTGRPIVTVTTHLGWKKVLKSWDRFQIPLPFSTCELISGAPVSVAPDASDDELTALTARLAEEMGLD